MPLYLRNSDTPYWFEYLPAEAVVYFQFNSVRDQPLEPIAAFCERLFTFIDPHQVSKAGHRPALERRGEHRPRPADAAPP